MIVLGVMENAKDGSLYVEGLDDVHKVLKDFWNVINNRQKVSSNILTDRMAVPEKLEGKDVEVTTSGGVDRTTLTLGFEGHQPDIEAMKLLYGNPDNLIEEINTQESKGEMGDDLKN